jgi:transposase-like protein
MTTRQRYSEELRAAALADVILLGPGATAAKYGIPRSTLSTWQQQFDIVHDPTVKKSRIEALAATYLEASLQALTAQAHVASDPDYIDRQPAEGLAILHGVMADKSVRLLEALYNADRRRARAAELDAG